MDDLETYLRKCYDRGVIDHMIRAQTNEHGVMTFYIHPASHNGDTLDLAVRGNRLYPAQIAQPDGTYEIKYIASEGADER